MMIRIREAESTQTIGDLRQRIAELEVQVRRCFRSDRLFNETIFSLFFQNQELITRGQILNERDLQDKFVELQDEVVRFDRRL